MGDKTFISASEIFENHLDLTRHSPVQKWRHIFQLILTALLLSSIFPFLVNSTQKGNSDIHGTMQTVGALLGMAIGFFLITRFINFGNRFHLFIGLAFFVGGAEDFTHGLFSLMNMDIDWLGSMSAPARFIVGTLVTGRLLLGVILILSLSIPQLMGEHQNTKLEAIWVITWVILGAVLITAITTLVPLNEMNIPGYSWMPFRPLDLVTALVLCIALSGYIRKYLSDSDMLTWWIAVSIAVNIISQVFKSLSGEIYDPLFVVSDTYKVIGYLIPLVGFSQYQIGSLNERLWSEMTLQRGKDELEEKVRERTVELEKVNTALRDELEERMRAEERMSRILAELAQFIENANAPIIGVDHDGRVNMWNLNAEMVTGFHRDDAMERHLVNEFITKGYRSRASDIFAKALKGVETAMVEVSMYTKDDHEVIILLNTTTRRDADGNIIGAMGFGQDITELTRYREKLEKLVEERTADLSRALIDTAEARDRIDAILKSVADGLIVTDIYNRVVLMNRAAEDFLNIRLSDVITRSIDFAIKEETLREKVKYTLNKKTTGYQFDFEIAGADPSHPRIMRARTSVIMSRDGTETGIVTIIHDVTQAREIERMKTEFLSTAAHELRTPLTSIQGFSEILLTRDNISPPDQKKFLTYINKQAVTLTGIVNDLLDISRIESRQGFLLEKTTCNICHNVRNIVPLFQEITKKHTFEIRLPDEPVELFIDKAKMGQVLKNILSNAVKYSPDGGNILVVGRKDGDRFTVSVQDQGIGMTPEQANRVFEKFYRATAGDSAPTGTGLGTTIVKYIVEAHGGEVTVDSTFGEGTTFTYWLPLL